MPKTKHWIWAHKIFISFLVCRIIHSLLLLLFHKNHGSQTHRYCRGAEAYNGSHCWSFPPSFPMKIKPNRSGQSKQTISSADSQSATPLQAQLYIFLDKWEVTVTWKSARFFFNRRTRGRKQFCLEQLLLSSPSCKCACKFKCLKNISFKNWPADKCIDL